jgi:hypothetical protein
MKLRNKKTGEIVELVGEFKRSDGKPDFTLDSYETLAKLNEEWEDAPEEEWRDVLGFEELYQVSNLGKVRTIKNGEAEMSQQENRNGYMTVHLRNKGVERRAMVHRLVAEAFISNPDELKDVNHKNGDKSDNRVENLEWVSHSDNMTHSFRELGKNVRHIVQLSLDGVLIDRWNSITEAAEATGICRTDIGACCRGERTMAGAFEWKYEEDYEEPKGIQDVYNVKNSVYIEMGSKEEAEKAVEKLKAITRLKGKKFRFDGYDVAHKSNGNLAGQIFYDAGNYSIEDVEKEMDLLFGGEE